MNSFLLVIKKTDLHEIKAVELCQKQNIDKIDTTVIDATPDKTQKSSEKGIGLIRKIISSISLKPIRSKKKAVIVLYCDKLSAPAQNALLKTLEEPPGNTTIILTAENEYSVLATIRSRCQIIKLSEPTEKETAEELDPDIKELEKAELLSKDKARALSYIEHEIDRLEKNLTGENPDQKNISIFQTQKRLTEYFTAYKLIKTTNINLRLCLENLFLSTTLD